MKITIPIPIQEPMCFEGEASQPVSAKNSPETPAGEKFQITTSNSANAIVRATSFSAASMAEAANVGRLAFGAMLDVAGPGVSFEVYVRNLTTGSQVYSGKHE